MDFAQVEADFGRLKADFDSGALTETEFKAKVDELMIEDDQGRWWIIGYKTGLWYVNDGENWVQQEPPRPETVFPASQRQQQVTTAPADVAELQMQLERGLQGRQDEVRKPRRRFWSIVALLFGLLVTFGAGFLFLQLAVEGEESAAIAAGIVGLIGLVASIWWARRIWRGK